MGLPATRRWVQLSVIVPVLNGGWELAACLDALQTSTLRPFEIIVVDDGCTEKTKELAQSRGAVYLRTAGHCGPGTARNLGARHARGGVLVFIDSDVVVSAGVLKRIANRFRRDQDLAGIFGSYDDTPFAPNFISQYKNLLHHYVHQSSASRSMTFWTGCGAIRANVFCAVGGFDESYGPRPTIEDIELGARLHQHGFRVMLDKKLQAKHLKCWTLRSMLTCDIFDRAIPWSLLILERGRMPRDLNLTYAARLSAAFAVLLILAAGALLSAALLGTRSWHYVFMAVSALSWGGLMKLNWSMYAFFARKHNLVFAARAVAMHWLYFLYSSAAWCGCWMWYRVICRGAAQEAEERSGLVRLPAYAETLPKAVRSDTTVSTARAGI